MKTIIRVLIITIACLQTFICYSQYSNNFIKYWYYRNRLNNYYVVPGEKWGESQIIAYRNKIYADNLNDPTDAGNNYPAKNVDYGQHGKYQGLYIGFLATECYLYNKNGQYEDDAKTFNETQNKQNKFN